MDTIQRVTFTLKTPIRGNFEVLRIDSEQFGIVFNASYKKKVYWGKTLGQAVGKMLDSINWQNVLK